MVYFIYHAATIRYGADYSTLSYSGIRRKGDVTNAFLMNVLFADTFDSLQSCLRVLILDDLFRIIYYSFPSCQILAMEREFK